jgi:hypothetical protein
MEELKNTINNLSKSDFLRIYLHVNDKYKILREIDSVSTSKALYYIKNSNKFKEQVYKQRELKKLNENN